jgi:hypothetical protein
MTRGTETTMGEYLYVLDLQIQENREQLNSLHDIARTENVKTAVWLTIALLLICVIASFAFLMSTGYEYVIERYSVLISTIGIFSIFGLIEAFVSFMNSISLLRRVKDLINRQITSIRKAETELSEDYCSS